MRSQFVDTRGYLNLDLGSEAGFGPGALVRVSRLSSGSLLVALDDSPPLIESWTRPDGQELVRRQSVRARKALRRRERDVGIEPPPGLVRRGRDADLPPAPSPEGEP